MIAKYRVTFHQISNDLWVRVELVSTTPEQALVFARRRFHLDQNWFHDGTELIKRIGED